MLLEIRILGFKLVLAPETVEALLVFIAAVLDGPGRDEKSASAKKTLD
jgi:hypothetical protein